MTIYPRLIEVALPIREISAESVRMALPQNILRPRISYPLLDVVWLSQKPYQAEIEEHILDGITVKIYSREKTVADCFKFRHKVEHSVALGAFKDYMHEPKRNLDELLRCA